MLAFVAVSVAFYVVRTVIRDYKAYKRRLNNPLLYMAEADCRRRHR